MQIKILNFWAKRMKNQFLIQKSEKKNIYFFLIIPITHASWYNKKVKNWPHYNQKEKF